MLDRPPLNAIDESIVLGLAAAAEALARRALAAAGTPQRYAVERESCREALRSEDAQGGVSAFLRGDRASFRGR